jgi:hypothetical protein
LGGPGGVRTLRMDSDKTRTQKPNSWRPEDRVNFPGWKSVLAPSPLPTAIREQNWRAVVGFLKPCENGRGSGTVTAAKEYLEALAMQGNQMIWIMGGFRWFFRESRKIHGPAARGPGGLVALSGTLKQEVADDASGGGDRGDASNPASLPRQLRQSWEQLHESRLASSVPSNFAVLSGRSSE